MESAESDTSASPEEMTKKSQESDDPSESESGEKKPTHIRLLVSKASAGSVIGKGGSTITEFQAKSGAQIQLSRKGGYFPGTTYRIVVISGTIKQVVTALELVFAKLHTEPQAEDASDVELRRIRFVVPHTFCGCIIGKRGATIKSFIENSKAGIKISLWDNTYVGISDRVVTLSGTKEEQMCAIDLILSKLTEDDDYSQQVHSPNSYAGHYHVGMHGYNSVKYARSRFGEEENNKEDVFNWVTMGVSDEYIRLLLWRRGSFLKTINVLTGARIKISGRGDFISGTTDRKVTISGLQSSIDLAMSMIQKQVDGAKALSLLRVSLRNRLHLST